MNKTYNKTYEEILDSMKNTYFAECGYAVEKNSQTMKRFEILASELFSLSCYADYIYRQAFVQSATGENLDRLGELRGCIRKTESQSSGALTFTLNEESDTEVIIEKDTVCSVAGKPYLQYVTLENAVIPPGELEVEVDAVSLGAGDEYNAGANTITVMVNAPVSVAGVTNKDTFSGGYTQEGDAAYRNRILRHYNIEPNSINAVSNENRVLALDFVVDCNIVPKSADSPMTIYVATKSNSLTREEEIAILDVIPVLDCTGITYEILLAQRLTFDLNVNAKIMTGFDKEEAKRLIRDRLSQVIGATRINESIPLCRLRNSLSDIEGLVDIEFGSSLIKGDAIVPEEFGVLSVAEIVVDCIYD